MGFVEVRAANPDLDPWIPGDGAEVIIPSRHLLPDAPREGIVINLPEMRVYAYLNGDDAPSTFALGIGRDGLDTPIGETSIVRKAVDPTWRPTKRMREEDPELPAVVPPGPDNPLGTHALYLGWPTYAMHGTNRPYGIGRRVSSGCIRMYPESIKEFYELVPVGTKVNVVVQPIKVAWIDNELFLEAHPDLDQAFAMEESGEVQKQKLSEDDMKHIIEIAGEYEALLNWPRIRAALRERKGYPIRIALRGSDESAEEQGATLEPEQNDESESERDEGAVAVEKEKQSQASGIKAAQDGDDLQDKIKSAAMIRKPKSGSGYLNQ